MLEIPEWDAPDWRANTVITLDLNYYYERSIENGLDPAHNESVHPTHGFKGINRETYKVRDYDVRDYEQGWGMWFLHRFDTPGLQDKTWDEAQTGVFCVNMRNFMLDPKNDGPIHARNKIIAQQVIDILENVYPPLTPISNGKEVLMPADKAVVAYRQWLAKFDDRGWRIDGEELGRRNHRNTAFAIPWPRRREGGSWVIEAVPLVGSREARKSAPAS
jgi:phenylpropionate dioxygenase-like ring-hydroxylating dioxygenase large terminal subunit